MRYDRKDLPEIADEYVLGLLEPGVQAEVEAAMERDADLRIAIAASRERFLPLDTGVEPAPVDEGLWEKIEAGLPAPRAVPAEAPPVAAPLPSSPPPSSNNDNRPPAWRTAALSALAASLLLAAGLGWAGLGWSLRAPNRSFRAVCKR